MLFGLKPYGVRTHDVYGSVSSHQNLMKVFLYQTRHLELYNYINCKVIRLVLREI